MPCERLEFGGGRNATFVMQGVEGGRQRFKRREFDAAHIARGRFFSVEHFAAEWTRPKTHVSHDTSRIESHRQETTRLCPRFVCEHAAHTMTRPSKLETNSVDAWLKAHDQWAREGEALVREFR